MTTQEFIDKYNGQGIDFDGYYGFQCMDLAEQYIKECLNLPKLPGPNAVDCWKTYQTDKYAQVPNTPAGVPQEGDIVIWGTGVGPYGHIAVFQKGDSNSFVSFDQNWPIGSLCHLQNHNYNNVLGWLHPLPPVVVPPTPTEPVITDQTKLDTPSDGTQEWGAIKSLLSDRKNTIVGLGNQLGQVQIDNQQLGTKINQLNEQIDQLEAALTQAQTPPSSGTTVQAPLPPSFKWALKYLFG